MKNCQLIRTLYYLWKILAATSPLSICLNRNPAGLQNFMEVKLGNKSRKWLSFILQILMIGWYIFALQICESISLHWTATEETVNSFSYFYFIFCMIASDFHAALYSETAKKLIDCILLIESNLNSQTFPDKSTRFTNSLSWKPIKDKFYICMILAKILNLIPTIHLQITCAYCLGLNFSPFWAIICVTPMFYIFNRSFVIISTITDLLYITCIFHMKQFKKINTIIQLKLSKKDSFNPSVKTQENISALVIRQEPEIKHEINFLLSMSQDLSNFQDLINSYFGIPVTLFVGFEMLSLTSFCFMISSNAYHKFLKSLEWMPIISILAIIFIIIPFFYGPELVYEQVIEKCMHVNNL